MSEPKKILIVTPLYPPDIGGPATYAKILVDELPSRGFKLVVLKFGDFLKYPYIIRHLFFFFKCLRKTYRTDIVFALDPLGVGLPSAFAAKILGKKFILKIVGDRAWETMAQKESNAESLDTYSKKQFIFSPLLFLKLGQRLTAFFADTIIVPSDYLKRVVINWGTDERKIKVIYNAFTGVEIKNTKDELREKFGLSGNVVISAGRLEKWKGFDTLIEVIKDIQNVSLLIAGDGPEKENLESIITRDNLSNRVKLLGILEHNKLMRYIKLADLFVLNTGYEGLSHMLLEVMSVGTSIITTDIGGNTELIENGVSGRLVGYDNREELNHAIEELFSNSELKGRLAVNAKQKSKQFSVERTVNELIKVIEII